MFRKRKAIAKVKEIRNEVLNGKFIVTQSRGLWISNLLNIYSGENAGFGRRLSRQLYPGDRIETTYAPLEEIIANQKKNIIGIIDEAIDYIDFNGLPTKFESGFLDKVDRIKNLWWVVGGTFGLGLAVGCWLERLGLSKLLSERL